MTTTIRRLDAAFASTVVAVYEPLIVRWVSGTGVTRYVADYANRLKSKSLTTKSGTAKPGLTQALKALRRVYPGATVDGTLIRLDGISTPAIEQAPRQGSVRFPVIENVPVRDTPELLAIDSLRPKLKKTIEGVLSEALAKFGTLPASELRRMVKHAIGPIVKEADLEPGMELMVIEGELLEYLSPIGVAHYFRQIYFSVGEGVGPIEQAFSVAPKESLELVVETIRTQIHEEVTEFGSEVVSESAVESRDINEVSDKVSTMLKRDSSTAISASLSASAQGGTAFFWASGSVNFNLNTNLSSSSQQAREIASRRLKEVTKRASERITRSFKSRVSDAVSVTTSSTMRRVIANEGTAPISYGLRRVYNKLRIQIQALGPRLVWQVYVPRPGLNLAQSRFVYFSESQPLTTQNTPPAVRPQPVGDTDRGTAIATVIYSNVAYQHQITYTIAPPPGRKITSVSVDNMTDIEYPDDDLKTSPVGPASIAPAGAGVQVTASVRRSRSNSVRIDYTYSWVPSDDVMNAWKAEVETANQALKSQEADARTKFLREDFERQRQLLVSKSKIRPRPEDDLRKEERYEIMNAMVRDLFRSQDTGAEVSPLDIELFHRYFDVDSTFYFVHPSWWQPRFRSGADGRPSYEIAAETEPAPMGSSLGWALQLDGDARRNEFLNSPWVRACVPIAPKREREALAWLSEHIEGKIGYDPNAQPLKGLLEDVERFRQQEAAAGTDGAEYATFAPLAQPTGGGTTPTPTVSPGAAVYPIIGSFEVATPTEGFVYDEIIVQV